MQRASFLDTVNSVALFIFLFITLSPYHGTAHTTEHGPTVYIDRYINISKNSLNVFKCF